MSLWIHLTSPTVAVQGTIAHAVAPLFKTNPKVADKNKRKTVDTLCGKNRARRLGVPTVNADGTPTGAISVIWPPYVEEMTEAGYTRCRECMRLSPGKPNRMVPEESRYKPPRSKAAS